MSTIDNNELRASGGNKGVRQAEGTQKAQKTKEQIGKVANTVLQFVPNDPATKNRIARIAQELYDYADEHNGAVGQEGFTKLLREITPENVVGVIIKYNNEVSPDESIIEMMLDEVLSSKEDIREALLGQGDGKNKLRGVFTVLLDRAKAVGMDDKTIKSYRTQFETALNKEFKGAAFLRSSKKMDEIIETVIQSIKNRIDENNKAAKAAVKQQTVPAKKHETDATNTIVNRYNKALKDFNQQMQKDGWAEDIADAMGRIWGENYADAVRKDLKVAKKQVLRLKAALNKGDEAFRAEFLNIFGVAYDTANINAYKNAENAYIIASKAKNNEDSFNEHFELLLNGNALAAETTSSTSTSVRGDVYTSLKVVKKEEVYERELNKVAQLFDSAIKSDTTGQYALMGITDGKSYVEKAIEAAGAKDKSVDEKYKVLQNIVSEIGKSLAAETKKACGGRSFEAVQKRYETCYKAAYGLENDILKRVTDYNISQQRGGGVVKGAAVAIVAIGAGFLTAGTGTAAVAGGTGAATAGGTAGGAIVAGALKGAATVAATSAAVEITDRFTSKEALDALRKDGVLAFLEKGAEITDWKQVATSSLVSGAMCLAFAGQSYAITNLTMKVATAAGASAETAGYTAAALSSAGFIGTGLGTEYLLQGEISVEGVSFTVIMALVSGVMQVRQVYKTAQATKAMQEQLLHENITNARKALGFEENENITLEKAEKAYKDIARKHHPNSSARTGDGAWHDAIFATAQNAIDVLRKNPTLINTKYIPGVNGSAGTVQEIKINPAYTKASDGAIVPVSHYQINPEFIISRISAQPGVYCSRGTLAAADGSKSFDVYRNNNNEILLAVEKDANGEILRTLEYTKGENGASNVSDLWTDKGLKQITVVVK